jgi:cytochrome c
MAQWFERNPDAKWGEDEPAHAIVPPADNSGVVAETEEGATQGVGHAYGAHTAHEVALWDRELRRAVAEGDRVFHDGSALGSTIAVSCDMCHPNAANTHPETYPKFQVQLGRVALLRDMINWCIEHPVRGQPMAADDPRMRAMEAYITAQRRGHALDYGRR